MTVEIALFAYLSEYEPDGLGGRHPRAFELPQGTVVADIIERLALPDEPRVVFINGKHAPDDALLSEGDRLAIFRRLRGMSLSWPIENLCSVPELASWTQASARL